MADQWGPWIGWNGGECPVEPTATVHACVAICGAKQEPRRADSWSWEMHIPNRIIAYRVKREPVVETVRTPAYVEGGSSWDVWGGGHDDGTGSLPVWNGFLVFETRDGIPDMTTLRWEDVE